MQVDLLKLVAIKMKTISVVLISAILLLECGVLSIDTPVKATDTRIINGQPSQRGQFPYYALVTIKVGDIVAGYCGGVLINRNWVLTAGHCIIYGLDYEIDLGAHSLNDSTEAGRLTLSSEYSVLHERYIGNPLLLRNDIGLIRLNATVNYTDTIQPVRLPSAGDNFSNVDVTVVGFGLISDDNQRPDVLQWANMTTISNWQCMRHYPFWNVGRGVICAEGRQSESPCSGDSGGPMVRASDNLLVGLTSFGRADGCSNGRPAGFTRITRFLPWINNVIKCDLNNETFY